MLVFERRSGQRTIITVPPSETETQIVIDVPAIGMNRVDLAFDAPRYVAIVRDDCRVPRPKDDACGVGPEYGDSSEKPSTINLRRPA